MESQAHEDTGKYPIQLIGGEKTIITTTMPSSTAHAAYEDHLSGQFTKKDGDRFRSMEIGHSDNAPRPEYPIEVIKDVAYIRSVESSRPNEYEPAIKFIKKEANHIAPTEAAENNPPRLRAEKSSLKVNGEFQEILGLNMEENHPMRMQKLLITDFKQEVSHIGTVGHSGNVSFWEASHAVTAAGMAMSKDERNLRAAERMVRKRQNPEYRAKENERKRQLRRDPLYRNQEQARDTERHRRARQNPEYRAMEQERDTERHRRARQDPEYKTMEQERNTEQHRNAREREREWQIVLTKYQVLS